MISGDPASPTMTVREAASALRVNVKTLYAEIQAGRFPAIRLGRSIRIARQVVTDALQVGQIPSPASGGCARKNR